MTAPPSPPSAPAPSPAPSPVSPPASKRGLWIGLAVLGVVAVLAYQYFGLGKLLTLDSLKSSRDSLADRKSVV